MKAHLGNQLIDREMRRTVTFAGMYLAGILLLCVMGLYPTYAKDRELQRSISRMKEKQMIQQRLQPFFIALMTAEDAIQCPPDLVYIEKEPLPRAGLLDFDKRIIAMADEFKMETVTVEVKVDEVKQGDLVVVDTCLAGDFNDFRQFLLHLGQVSWVQDFETLKINGHRNEEQLNIEFQLALE